MAHRKYFHEQAFPKSDVDIFIYGLTATQATAKIEGIENCIKGNVVGEVTVRSLTATYLQTMH